MLANTSKILAEDQQIYSEHEISIAGTGNTPTRAPRSWEGTSEPGTGRSAITPPPFVHSPLVILGNHTVLPQQPYNDPCTDHVPEGRG